MGSAPGIALGSDESTLRDGTPVPRDGSSTGTGDGDAWLARVAHAPAVPAENVALALPRPGDRVGGQFEVVRLLGRGGMARVYLGRDVLLGRQVAVKLMAPPADVARAVERWIALFEREARATARMSHPNVVTIHQFGTWNGHPFLVLERLHGATLAERLRRGPLPRREALDVAAQVLRALVHAHGRGILHRDLKPQNVWLTDEGGVKVLDFGLALLAGAAEGGEPGALGDVSVTRTVLRAGTPAYMAPEQWQGEPQDARTDVWALGVMLVEALSGRLPFRAGTAAELRERVCDGDGPGIDDDVASLLPVDLREVVVGALCRRREGRPDARALLDRIEGLMTSRPADPPSPEASASPYRWLEPFGTSDAAWFFGRERDVARLVALLETRPAVVVVAPSGAGKSSLVHAGLVPRLSAQGRWAALSFRPGRAPLRVLRERVAELCGAEAAEVLGPDGAGIAVSPGAVGQVLRRHAEATGARVLVVVDQLEELYTLAEEGERAAFAAALQGLADDAGAPVRLAATVRDDFLSRLASGFDPHGAVLGGLFVLAPPDEAALREALVRPAERVGLAFEGSLAEDMVAALRGRAAPLPLLQLAASRLYERRDLERGLLTRDALQELGGMEGILAAHADEVVDALVDPGDVRLARQLLCALVTPERTRRQRDRGRLAQVADDPPGAERVIDHLLQGRLLAATRADDGIRVELVHEALIARWDRLRLWLEEDRDLRRFRERVLEAANHWAETGRPAGLLWSDDVLAETRRWRERYGGALSQVERDFLGAAEARHRRASTRARARRAALGAMGIALVVGSLVSARMLRSREHLAREARDEALAQLLTYDARAEGERDAIAALDLATRAAERMPSTRVSDALREALGRPYPVGGARLHTQRIAYAEADPRGTGLLTASFDGTVRTWGWQGQAVAVLAGHSGAIERARYSPSGDRIASASYDGSGRIWASDGRPLAVMRSPGSPLRHVAWAPDGLALVLTGEDGYAQLWSAGGRPGPILSGHRGEVHVAAFQPGGSRVATGSEDGVVRVFDRAGRTLGTARVGEGSVHALAWSPRGDLLVSATNADSEVRAFTPDLLPRGEWMGHEAGVTWAAWTPDSGAVTTLSYDNTARLWAADGTPLAHFHRHTGRPLRASFSPDGLLMATAADDGTVRVWTLDGTPLAVLRGHDHWVEAVLWAPDGERLATASADGWIKVWALDDGARAVHRALAEKAAEGRVRPFRPPGPVEEADRERRVWFDEKDGERWVLSGHRRWVEAARPSPDGALVVTTSSDRVARLWRATDGAAVAVLRGHGSWVTQAQWSPDGALLATASDDGTVRLWDRDGRPAGVLAGHEGPARAVAFSPDGTSIASGGDDGRQGLWARDGTPRIRGGAGGAATTQVAFSPDGAHVAWGAADGTVEVRARDGSLVARHRDLDAACAGLAFRKDGSVLAAADIAGRVMLWDRSGRRVATIPPHRERVLGLAFSPDGERLLTTSLDGTARLWDADGRPVAEPVRATAPVYSSGFDPSGARALVFAGHHAWILSRDGVVQGKLIGHDGAVVGARFSPDGTRVLTEGFDGTARVWDASGQAVATLRGHPGRSVLGVFSPDGRRVITFGDDASDLVHELDADVLVRRARERLRRVEHFSGFTPLLR